MSNTTKVKVLLAGISALILSVGIARFAYTPFLPLMLEQTELNTFYGGWLATFNYLGYLFGLLLISQINNLQFKFKLYRMSLIVAFVTTVAMGMTTDIVIWSILRLLAGMSSTAGIILAAGFVMSWLKQQGFKAQLGLHFSGLGLGIAIPGVLIVYMNQYYGWATQWIIMGIFGLLFLIPAWYWMPTPDKTPNKQFVTIKPPSKRWMNLMIAAYSCAGVGYVISATFIVAILENKPELHGKGDWIWVILGLAAVPSCIVWDKISTRIGEVKALILSYSVLLVAIVIPAVSTTLSLNIIGALLFGATFAGIVSMMLVYMGHKFPADPAKAMAKLTICYGIAQIIAPAIAAQISKITHSYSGALWLAAVTVLLGVVLLGFIYKEEVKSVRTDGANAQTVEP